MANICKDCSFFINQKAINGYMVSPHCLARQVPRRMEDIRALKKHNDLKAEGKRWEGFDPERIKMQYLPIAASDNACTQFEKQ